MRISVFILVLYVFVVSCQSQHGTDEKETAPNLADFKFLIGNWSVVTVDNAYETWVVEDGHYSGVGYMVEHGDTQVIEYLTLSEKDGKLILTADVIVNDEPVVFKPVFQDDVWIFQNLQHDYPKQICYSPKDENQMDVWIAGEPGSNKMHFEYSRLNQAH